MAEKMTAGSLKLSATFSYMKNGQSEIKVTKENSMILQLIEVSFVFVVKNHCTPLINISYF